MKKLPKKLKKIKQKPNRGGYLDCVGIKSKGLGKVSLPTYTDFRSDISNEDAHPMSGLGDLGKW
jgi:hypothetical protein